NTIHQPAVSRWAVNIRDRSLDNAVRNNILVSNHPTRGAISVWQDSTAGFTSDYNVLIPRFTLDDGSSVIGLAAWRAATGNDLHSLAAGTQADLSSLFVDVAAADYRLKPGAVAIDAGSSLGAPSADLLGTPRPQGSAVDIGALEAPGQALAGDFDGNGRVDAADLAAWRMGFAAGTRTGGDFVVWQRQLGIGAGAGAVVAEPGGGGLGVVGGVVVGALSRKRRAKK
ncbi:MAG TPA: choice-of-anchor Q domain-containing protein, partial [Lacipirellulaceae bacterium]|nr:choice-of-anchor Q domain-containing protein [Lacipirellulaceae bacterium]